MWFLRPLGFVGLIILPLILALYLFKNKQKNINVSSAFLWAAAQQDRSAQTSIQRIKKSLLLFLQLLAALLCVFALTRPYIRAENDVNNYKIVIDNSLSMSADEGGKTRLDMAKAGAVDLVRGSAGGSTFSVITINGRQDCLVSSSDNKRDVIEKINAVGQSYLPVDYSLVPEPNENENLVLFSDTGGDTEGVSFYTYGTAFDNCGIISLTADDDGKKVSVLGKVKNFGSNTVKKHLSVYADEKLYDTEELTIAPDETKDIIFTQINSGAKQIKAQLDEPDRFTCDDTRCAVIGKDSRIKVFFGAENEFIARVLSVMPSVELYRSKDGTSSTTGCDLYVYEGKVPDNLPADGHILIIDPDENSLFKVDGETQASNLRCGSTSVMELTNKPDFSILKSKKITLPDWGEAIVTCDETPLIFAGSRDKQKIMVIGFDLANSDLPLKTDFPVLIYDMMNAFFPSGAVEGGSAEVGTAVKAAVSPLADEAYIITPDESEKKIAPPFPAADFTADTTGIYTLKQIIDGKAVYEPFAVNIAYTDEQYFNYDTEGKTSDATGVRAKYNYGLSWIFLLLAAALLAGEFALYIYKNKKRLTLTDAILRAMVLILVVSAIFEPRIKLPSKGITTVFALDVSDSMSQNTDKALQFINESLKNRKKDDYSAFVTFGKNGDIISSADDSAKVQKYTIGSFPDKTATNIEAGAQTAASLFKEGTGRRIVLFTDGSENSGDILSFVRNMKADGVEFKTVGYDNTIADEVQLTAIKVPEFITSDTCNAEITIDSTAAQDTVLKLYVNGSEAYNSNVSLSKGQNSYIVNCPVKDKGNIEFKAVVEPQNDKFYQNNAAYAHSTVKDVPKVLLLEWENSGDRLYELIKSGGVSVDRKTVNAAEGTLDALNGYEAVVLADCPYDEMSESFVTALEGYVKNSAGGLFVTAGENSMAPGGYKDTVLEKIMPVNMDMSDEDNKKNTAMVMVMDRSGSMEWSQYGVSKLELVKEAMVRSVQTLDSGDSVGIIAFDSEPQWVAELQTLTASTKGIENKVYSINSGGGTSILPALNEAVQKLTDYDADSKHIILMTDGQDSGSGYDNAINTAKSNGITVSTVAVGSDSDTSLLKQIAQSAGGRYYYTDEFSDLPKIFERETQISNRKYINNEDFYPTVSKVNDLLKGVDNMPQLNGYIACDKKSQADTVLTHNGEEPLLAKWQYGLGHTAVFSVDIDNQASGFIAAEEGQRIIKNTLASVMRSRSFGDIKTDIRAVGNKKIITVQTGDSSVFSISSTLEGEGYSASPVFEQVKAGVFEAKCDVAKAGNYVLNLSLKDDKGERYAGSILSVPYSDEYSIAQLKGGADKLKALYDNTEMVDSPQGIFTKLDNSVSGKTGISLYLIILAMVLFFAELVLRRFRPKLKLKSKTVEQQEEKEHEKKAPEPKPEPQQQPQVQQNAVTTSSMLLKNKHKRDK